MYDTHTLAEWAAFLSLGIGIPAGVSAPYFLFVEADYFAWPRPLTAAVDRGRLAVWDAVRSDAVWPLLREWSNTKCDVREIPSDVREFAADARTFARLSLRDTAFTATALLALLLPAAGGTR